MQFVRVQDFGQWRDAARRLIAHSIPPEDVTWITGTDQLSLFEAELEPHEEQTTPSKANFNVPKQFIELAKYVACHRNPVRWTLLYRILWRLVHNETHLLKISTDHDVHRMLQMSKSVTRDVHKMKAFVRFRKVELEKENEVFVAWHRPDHLVLPLAAPFFARRFVEMNWSILTPDASVSWDQHQLTFAEGVPSSAAPDHDSLEELWKSYYASIFNPARVKVNAMKKEMPVRHWPTLPEAELIPDLLAKASSRVESMILNQEGFAATAVSFFPVDRSLSSLKKAAADCRACDLHCQATQTVFGIGPGDARIVIVGEQPGDQEDTAGEPFVGPAGQLLNKVLHEVEINRHTVYLTNVVKHFKFVDQDGIHGKRRLHKKPNSREIFACRPWLEAELATINPDVIVCLGATASQALLGRDFRITAERGRIRSSDWCRHTIATWHPAAILRMSDPQRRAQMQKQFADDLRSIRKLLD